MTAFPEENPMRRFIIRGPKSRRIADRLAYAKHVAERLTNNPDFPEPLPAHARLVVHLAAAEAALVTSLTRARGTAAALKAALRAVEGDLKTLHVFVEVAANQRPGDGAAMIARAGMSLKNARGPSRPTLKVRQGRIPGSVLVDARAVGRKASYEWQYSTDQKLWVTAETNFECKAELFGLKRATRYFFRFRARTRKGLGKWSDAVSMIVS
jgi:hypothetical protein